MMIEVHLFIFYCCIRSAIDFTLTLQVKSRLWIHVFVFMLKLYLSPRREASPLSAVPICLSLRATPGSPHALTHWGEAVQVRPVCLSLQRPQQLVAPPPAAPQDPVFEDGTFPLCHQEDAELHAEEDQLAGLWPASARQRGAAKVRLSERPVSNGSSPLELRV